MPHDDIVTESADLSSSYNDSYNETEGMPVGETDAYLVDMVSSVESDAASRQRKEVRVDPLDDTQACRRVRLLKGEL